MSANQWNSRTALLLGEERLSKLNNAHVLVVGLGGVGAAAAEMIARSGVGKMTIVDGDVVEASNRNRQLGALVSTDGQLKSEAVGGRLRDINPDLELTIISTYLEEQEIDALLASKPFDYVLDCIDTVAPKLALITHAIRRDIRIVSSMGAGGKIDPSLVRIGDISESYNCKLAYYVRKRLKKKGIYQGLKVVYSIEEIEEERVVVKEGMKNKKSVIGTISYLPPIFGATCASIAIRDLIGKEVKLRVIKPEDKEQFVRKAGKKPARIQNKPQ